MRFGFAQFSTDGIPTGKGNLKTNLDKDLEKYFKNKDYGSTVDSFTIGLHLYHPDWKTIFNDSVTYNKKWKELEYGIFLPFFEFIIGDDYESMQIIRDEVVNSLDKIRTVKSLDFDVEAFKNDFLEFFKTYVPNSDNPVPETPEETAERWAYNIKRWDFPNFDFNVEAFKMDLLEYFKTYMPNSSEPAPEKKEESSERWAYIMKYWFSGAKVKWSFPKNKKMPYEQFWNLIEESRILSEGNFDKQVKILTEMLSKMDEKDIVKYECTFREILMKSHHYNIMAMQKCIEGFVSDDTFLYFRAGLISFGEAIYMDSIKNPDSHADEFYFDIDMNGEAMLYVADEAFKRKFGGDVLDANKELPRDIASQTIDYDNSGYEIKGKDWNEEDLPKKYPKLWKKYEKQRI